MKPVLFMRRRSLYGPFFGKHAGVTGLSKSAGGFIAKNNAVANAVTNNGVVVINNGEVVTNNA